MDGHKFMECETEVSQLARDAKLKIYAQIFEVGGAAPVDIIRSDQDWYVKVGWEFTGQIARHMTGKWHVSVALTPVGPGTAYQLPTPPATVDMDPCGDGTYETTISVNAGDIAARDTDGTLYIVALTLGSTDACGRTSHMFAHCTGAHLHFIPTP